LLEKKIEVKLFCPKDYNGHWMLHLENDYFTNEKAILAPRNDFKNVSLFTHELLHLYLDHCHGMHIRAVDLIYIGKNLIEKHNLNEKVDFANFQPLLCDFINNLQHYKMLPLFIEADFKQEDFISNYYELLEPHALLLNPNPKCFDDEAFRYGFAMDFGFTMSHLMFELNPIHKDCNLHNLISEFLEIVSQFINEVDKNEK
jgi:hypothetical protein